MKSNELKKIGFNFEYIIHSIAVVFFAAVIIIWFKDGLLLATGEEGLVLANPGKSIELYNSAWIEVGAGLAVPGVNPEVPYLFLVAIFNQLGLQIWLIQALSFYFLMIIGYFSMYSLVKYLFRNRLDPEKLVVMATIAGLFYVFNPISMLGIWYRFAFSFMTFFALAPLFLYMFIVGLERKRSFYIFLLPLLTLPFSFVYSAPSSVLLLWALPFLYVLITKVIGNIRSLRSLAYPLIYFSLMLGFWLLISLWWIYPFIELSKMAFASETSLEHAIGTLKANSADFTLNNVIRLIHGGFLYRGEAFGSIYKTPVFLVLSWLIPIVMLIGILKIKTGRLKLFLVGSLLLLLFLVKGTSPPFGEIFLWIFKSSTVFQLYRNPLEKIGLILPIVYAPIFAFGLVYLGFKLKNKYKSYIFFFLAVSLLMLFHWPFFTGAMVFFGNRDIRVEVPTSFQLANQAIPPGNHIILSLPVMGGASGFHNWKHGYAGVESSEYLFKYPTITKFYDAKSFIGKVLIAESHGDLDNNLIGVAQLFSADIVVNRIDTNAEAFGYNFDAVERSNKKIKESKLRPLFDSPEVALWQLPDEKIVPVVYVPDSVKIGQSPVELITLLNNHQFNPQTEAFICDDAVVCSPPFQEGKELLLESLSRPDKIEVTKRNANEYEIGVINSKGRFLLVFNNSYHPGWIVRVNGREFVRDKHIVANGYANGFVIDDAGDLRISLYFAPYRTMKVAYNISLAAVVFGGVSLFILSIFKLVRRIYGK